MDKKHYTCVHCMHDTWHTNGKCDKCGTVNNPYMKEIGTGGNCEHYYLRYPKFGVGVLLNNEYTKAPKEGEDFDLGIYFLESDGSMGDHVSDDCFTTLEDFRLKEIYSRIEGYLEGKGYEQVGLHAPFKGEIHFPKATDLYMWLDENEIQCPITIKLHLEK